VTARVLLRAAGAIALAALSGALLAPLPAAAHTTLKTSDPAAGATVQLLPDVVRLTFSETLPILPKVTVTDADGVTVSTGPVTTSGSTASQPVQSAKAGRFAVKWELTGADGHKTTGTFTFTVTTAPPPPSPTAAPTPTAAATSAAPAPVATSPAAERAATSSGPPALLWIVAAAVLLAAAAVFLVLRRRRS